MKFASALSTNLDHRAVIDDLVHEIRSELGPVKIDLALVFAHRDFVADGPEFLAALRQGLGARHVVGCTGGGIIGDRQECEGQPAVSVLAAQLPGVEIDVFHTTAELVDDATGPGFWHFQLEVAPEAKPSFLVFLDPFSTNAPAWVDGLAGAYPGATILGGLSSGGRQPGDCRLFLDDAVLDEGAVGVALSGPVELRSIVSQGCQPIGQPLTITRADKNVIFELAGKPPLAVLNEMLPDLSVGDQKLAQSALLLGRVINEYQDEFGRGDFLIRNLVGHDPKSGALAVGDFMRTGQTVQFQVRDGGSAAEELQALLAGERSAQVRGAVLFSCLGRGEGMYGETNHDIGAVQRAVGPIPAAGFFANGEIGPVSAKPFVHGFTCVIGLFVEPVSPA